MNFNKPYFAGKELLHITKSVSNSHVSGNGPFTKKCHSFFEKRYSSVALQNPDFIKIADGFGVAGSMVSDPKDLEKSIDIMLKHDGPYLLHVRVEKEENIFPMIQTGASVGEIRLE